MPIPPRKKRKRIIAYILPRKECPMCGRIVSLTSGGKVPSHLDGQFPCPFHHMRLEQYHMLVQEGLLVTKRDRARHIAKSALDKVGLSLRDLQRE